MAKKYKTNTQRGSVSQVTDAIAELVALGEELQERADNTPDNLQGGDLHSRLEEAAGSLTGLDEPDVPDAAEGLEITYQRLDPYGKTPMPRWMRGANEVAIIDAAQGAVQALVDQIGDLMAGLTDEEDDQDGPAPTVVFQSEPRTFEELEEIKGALEEFADALGTIVDEASGIEYPGRN